jgi:hypothetical protein
MAAPTPAAACSALAALAGVGGQWVVELERGKSRAPIDLLIKTAAAVGYALHVCDDMPRGDRIG